MEIFHKIRDMLSPRERRNAMLLFGMMMIMGLMDIIGIASVMPFVAVLSNPDIIETNAYLSALYNKLGFSSINSFLLFLGASLFVLVVGSLLFKSLTYWVTARFSQMRKYSIGSRLLMGYLERPYSFFLNRHSAELGKSVLSEVNQVVNNTLMPIMNLVANSIVAMFLIILIIVVNPVVALCAVLLFGGAYSIIYSVFRKYLSRIGAERLNANKERFRVAQEALGGIKDIKVLGLEQGYIRSFRKPALRFARTSANSQIVGELPHFALQALVLGGTLILLMYLVNTREGDLSAILPLIVVYVISGSRLNPALKKIYSALTSIRFGKPALDLLHQDFLETCLIGKSAIINSSKNKDLDPINLNTELKLDKITYTYPAAEQPALVDLSLTIPANTTVGLVGSTGAGKTTVVDIVLGLLSPQQGQLRVDGKVIEESIISAWQRNIGYVPQHIFLTDDSVAGNIAFGLSPEDINQEAVEEAARIAEIHEFVMRDMPDGYQTLVGERGVRLSGGQRQRIGIARALYRNPDVLVFDEATSALDNVTERAVMDAIHNLSHKKTIILIAHRLSTIKQCDNIFMLQHGHLVDVGNYEELLNSSKSFQEMADLY